MTSLVQRKARTGRDAQAARAMSLGRALRLMAAKQADQLMALPLNTLSVTRKALDPADIAATLEGESLILVMDGPNDQVAAVLLEPVIVAGLIQQQTMGKVTAAQEGAAARQHTATDAALCAPFVEALLKRAALLPDETAERELLQGYRFGVWAREPRQAQLVLDAAAYDLIEMTLDLAGGVRAGKLTLILPELARARVTPDQESAGDAPDARDAPSLEKLGQNILSLNAELMIALTRMKLPLHRVLDLKAGDVLDLNLSSMAQALVIDGNGRAVSRGTLGQIDGMRALQVEQQKKGQRTQPRRRATDREALDLPDVTGARAAASAVAAPFAMDGDEYDVDLPSMSDVDIFGDLDNLPELPDMDEAARAADAHMAGASGANRKEDMSDSLRTA